MKKQRQIKKPQLRPQTIIKCSEQQAIKEASRGTGAQETAQQILDFIGGVINDK